MKFLLIFTLSFQVFAQREAFQDSYNDSCLEEIDSGLKIIVDNPQYKSKTGVLQKYSIQRLTQSSFKIGVNYSFVEESSNKILDDNEIYIDRVNECFTELNPFLNDSRGGNIELFLDKDAPLIRIQGARESSDRGHYKYMTKHIFNNCATVVHETFHHLGLVDEYKEDLITVQDETAYSCRATGPAHTMMNKYNGIKKLIDLGLKSSYLTDYQFDNSVYGSCLKSDSFYSKCAMLSYRTKKVDDKIICGSESLRNVCRMYFDLNKPALKLKDDFFDEFEILLKDISENSYHLGFYITEASLESKKKLINMLLARLTDLSSVKEITLSSFGFSQAFAGLPGDLYSQNFIDRLLANDPGRAVLGNLLGQRTISHLRFDDKWIEDFIYERMNYFNLSRNHPRVQDFGVYSYHTNYSYFKNFVLASKFNMSIVKKYIDEYGFYDKDLLVTGPSK